MVNWKSLSVFAGGLMMVSKASSQSTTTFDFEAPVTEFRAPWADPFVGPDKFEKPGNCCCIGGLEFGFSGIVPDHDLESENDPARDRLVASGADLAALLPDLPGVQVQPREKDCGRQDNRLDVEVLVHSGGRVEQHPVEVLDVQLPGLVPPREDHHAAVVVA
jgi:hypothetical protein